MPKARQQIALELLFSKLAYIGSDCEAEQMLGIDPVGTCEDRPESNDGRDDQQHRLHDLCPEVHHSFARRPTYTASGCAGVTMR